MIEFRPWMHNTTSGAMLTSPLFPATYHVSGAGNDGNDGLSPESPWLTVAKVNGATFRPGDFIAFNRGDTWNERLLPPISGTAGSYIDFGAYGIGARPILDMHLSISGWGTIGNWADEGGDVWSFSLALNPRRIWLSETEYLKAELVGDIDATSRWFWDDPTDTLSVYATANPAAFYSDVQGAHVEGNGDVIQILGKNYLTFQDIDIRGGLTTFWIGGCDYINVFRCAIGLYSWRAIMIRRNGVVQSDYGELADCTVESGFDFTYDYEQPGPSDGLTLQNGANSWNVHDNVVSNWGHNCISLGCDDVSYTCADNLVHGNDVSSPNTSYCRGLSVEGKAGLTDGIEVYNNLFHDLTVRSQLTCDGVKFYYNLCHDIAESPAVVGEVGQAIGLAIYGGLVCQSNEIYNNVIYNVASVGLRLTTNAGGPATDITLNLIKNNIFFNCGVDSVTWPNQAVHVENSADVNTNTFDNNLFYKNGSATPIDYRGTDYSVVNFEGNLANGDSASNNLQVDPVLVDAPNDDFHLQVGSPCRNVGADVGLLTDYDGVSVPQETNPAIGAYEYVA